MQDLPTMCVSVCMRVYVCACVCACVCSFGKDNYSPFSDLQPHLAISGDDIHCGDSPLPSSDEPDSCDFVNMESTHSSGLWCHHVGMI